MKILNFGSLNIDHVYLLDHLVREGETIISTKYNQFPGGKGLNQSIALARAGLDVYHAGKISPEGEFLLNLLNENNVNTDNIVIDKNTMTGHAIIQVNEQGENSIILYGGSNQEIEKKDIDETLKHFSKGDCLLLQNEINNVSYVMQKAKEKGMKIIFNPAPFHDTVLDYPLEYVDILIVNEIEGKDLTGETEPRSILNKMMEKFENTILVLTLGDEGSMMLFDGVVYSQEADKSIKVKDTTAAGDTFIGYLIYGLQRFKCPQELLLFATKASSQCVSKLGASSSIPKLNEVI